MSRSGDAFGPREAASSLAGGRGAGEDRYDRYGFGHDMAKAGFNYTTPRPADRFLPESTSYMDANPGDSFRYGQSSLSNSAYRAGSPARRTASGHYSGYDYTSPLAPLRGASSELEGEDGLALKEEADPDERRAGIVRHHCTDMVCLVVFLLALVPYGMILRHSLQHGDLRRLYHGHDFLGNLCGGNKTLGKDYLFWCIDASNSNAIDLEHPICRESCPTGPETHETCFLGSFKGPLFDRDFATGSFKQTTSFVQGIIDDYPTTAFAGRYCVPENPILAQQVHEANTVGLAPRLISGVASLAKAWQPLYIAMGLAAITGYFYLMLLRYVAGAVVHACLWIVNLSLLFVGGYLVITYWTGGLDGVPSTGDGELDLYVGLGCTALSVLFVGMTCCAEEAIQIASGCVEAACEVISGMPSLLMEPIVSLFLKFTACLGMALGFALLLSCGEVETVTLQQYAVMKSTPEFAGIGRMEFSELQIQSMVYFAFVSFWIFEVLQALSQFVIAYATQLWYFAPYNAHGGKDVQCCPLMRGARVALLYHLGSLAFGSLLVFITRPARVVLGFLNRQAQQDNNECGRMCAACCCLPVALYERCLAFVNKNAYMDVAVTSRDFCRAGRQAFRVLEGTPQIRALHGACWVFQVAGVGIITGAGCGIMFLMIKCNAYFSDPGSPAFVEEPLETTVIAGVLCCLVAVAFVIVFDMVSDTMLFCYANGQNRGGRGLPTLGPDQGFAPATLQRALGIASGGYQRHKLSYAEHMVS